MTPLEMFNDLIRLGYITPVSQSPDFSYPSLYRDVPSITTSGTGIDSVVSASDAELECGPKGNQRD